jgi:hypothetical protein
MFQNVIANNDIKAVVLKSKSRISAFTSTIGENKSAEV